MSEEVLLKIYVIGGDAVSEKAIADLRRLCEDKLDDRYSLEIIDILKHPQLAEEAQIMAVPTVDKIQPEPVRRIIGSMADGDAVLSDLELNPGIL